MLAQLLTYYDKICDIVDAINTDVFNILAERPTPRPPTQAFSDFAIHREQGDWAEEILTRGLKDAIETEYDVVKYGKGDKIIAGQQGFREFYNEYQRELSSIGKRPDVLILPKNISSSKDISKMNTSEITKYVESALCGIEIRSSAFLIKKYSIKNIDNDKKFLSFTPKVEDIQVVLRWVKTYNVPHYYAQVFFDEIHIISFHKILEIIQCYSNESKPNKTICKIDKNQRSQLKSTIHINISQGKKIGGIEIPPKHQSVRTELDSGRILHYVRFTDGIIKLDSDALKEIIDESK